MATRFDRRTFLGRAARVGVLVPASGGLAVLLGGCGERARNPQAAGGGAGGPAQTYTTALGFLPSFMETFVAKEQGFWSNRGLEVEIRGGQGTASAIQSVIGGSSAYSRASGINSIIAVADQQAPIVNVGTVYQRSQFVLASLADKAITDPTQLAGKSVGVVSSGGSTENLLDVMLTTAGVPKTEVSRPVTGVGAAAYQLARDGQVDAWIALDGDIAQLTEQQGAQLTTVNTDEYAPIPADSYVAAQTVLQATPDAVPKFLAGVLDAMRFTMDQGNWDAVVEAVRFYNPELQEDVARFQIPLEIEKWTAAGTDKLLEMDPARWEQGVQGLAAAGLVQNTVPADRLIDPAPLTQARSL